MHNKRDKLIIKLWNNVSVEVKSSSPVRYSKDVSKMPTVNANPVFRATVIV